MARLPRRSAFPVQALVAVLLALGGCATVKPESPASRPSSLIRAGTSAADADAIDRLFGQYDLPDVPGAALVVIKNGRVVFLRGYGLAELETRTPVTERTNFRLASLTKAFTAMGIMLLVKDGRLQFDDRVRDVLPGFPAYGSEIRIRHLLTHTSGLRAYQDFVPESQTRQIKDREVLALLHRASTTYFRPGSAFRYGDSGYAILALVVEQVSGDSFARFLHHRIFARIGMETTVAYEAGVSTVPDRAIGYAPTPTGFRVADQSATSAVLGDGGIYSSVRDLVAWDRAQDSHVLIDARLQQLAWTPAVLPDGTPTRSGFGWFIDRDTTRFQLSHRGETSGFTNFILKYPDRGLTIVVLTNRRGGALGDIAATLATLPSFRPTL